MHLSTSTSTASCCSRRPQHQQLVARRACLSRPVVVARAEGSSGRERSDGFVTGFVVGGALFGLLGFVFAPQISKALIGDDQRLRLPRFLEEEAKDPAQTRQELIDKIANLNASMDEVAAQLGKTSRQANEVAAHADAATVNKDLKKMLQL